MFTDQPLAIVYVLTNPAMPGLVKIGRTYTNGIEARISQLYTTGVPFPFQVEFACRVPNPEEVESALHLAFGPNRVNPRREFFEIDPAQAIAILKLLHVEDATAEIQQQTDPIPSEDHTAAQQFLNRRPNFIFPEMGIPLGATIHFTNADIPAEIIGPRKVRCQGEESSLTAATRRLLGLDYNVNPCRYWTYNGRNLNALYDETYTIVR